MHAQIRTDARKTPRQRRAKVTLTAILDAAAQVLIELGYEGTTTNRIAERAGVSIGSLYQYYPNKEAVIAALIDRHHEECRAVLLKNLGDAASGDLRQGIRTVIRAQLAAHRFDPKLHRVLLEQVPKVDRLWSLHALEEDCAELLRPLLEARRAELRVQNLELAVPLLVALVEGALQYAVGRHPKLIRSPEYVEEVAVMVERYLLP